MLQSYDRALGRCRADREIQMAIYPSQDVDSVQDIDSSEDSGSAQRQAPSAASTSREQGGSQVTRLLLRWRQGDAAALEQVTPLIYDQLRRHARHYMREERDGHILQTTALVHETFIKLVDVELEWRDRVHFFAVASRLMRRVLVDFARRRQAEKRGGDVTMIALDETLVAGAADAATGLDVLALDQALERLASIDQRKARVVELRCFGGLTIDEVAEVLEVSHATVERDLSFARAWLARRLAVPAG